MSRNLVVCLDGTDDQFDTTNSNVVKLYQMLQRNTADQLTYYQTGVGTIVPFFGLGRLGRRLLKWVDAAVAFLLRYHVRRAYRFLMQTYQPGDAIFLFGFSRGAYSARVLAGMLHKVGLLSAGNDELVPFAWRMFKRRRNAALARGFRDTFSRTVAVHFLGVWDTVSSVGWIWDPKHYPHTAANPSVQTLRHAVSLDERRADFIQNLWKPLDGQDAREVWFPGVHCDIGGGYSETEAGLSKITLRWMVAEAQACGLLVDPERRDALLPTHDTAAATAPSPLGTLHRSLRGWWWLAEVLPRLTRDPRHDYHRRVTVHLGRHRDVPRDASIDASVHARMADDRSYRPPNLPPT